MMEVKHAFQSIITSRENDCTTLSHAAVLIEHRTAVVNFSILLAPPSPGHNTWTCLFQFFLIYWIRIIKDKDLKNIFLLKISDWINSKMLMKL